MQSQQQKVTRPAVSCGNLDQKQRNEQQLLKQQQQEQQTRSEAGDEAGGDFNEEMQNLQLEPKQEEQQPQPNFVDRYMNFMQEKLTHDRRNDFRWDW